MFLVTLAADRIDTWPELSKGSLQIFVDEFLIIPSDEISRFLQRVPEQRNSSIG